MTKWKGFVSVHRGDCGPQIACGPSVEFTTTHDDVERARAELLDRWKRDGRKVSAQWTDADDAHTYPNIERAR